MYNTATNPICQTIPDPLHDSRPPAPPPPVGQWPVQVMQTTRLGPVYCTCAYIHIIYTVHTYITTDRFQKFLNWQLFELGERFAKSWEGTGAIWYAIQFHGVCTSGGMRL